MSDKKASGKTRKQTSKPKLRVFRVGDLAVYPAHGVGKIQAIESRVINGEKHDFYIMKVLENNMLIMIPTKNVESVGLRDIIDKKHETNKDKESKNNVNDKRLQFCHASFPVYCVHRLKREKILINLMGCFLSYHKTALAQCLLLLAQL